MSDRIAQVSFELMDARTNTALLADVGTHLVQVIDSELGIQGFSVADDSSYRVMPTYDRVQDHVLLRTERAEMIAGFAAMRHDVMVLLCRTPERKGFFYQSEDRERKYPIVWRESDAAYEALFGYAQRMTQFTN